MHFLFRARVAGKGKARKAFRDRPVSLLYRDKASHCWGSKIKSKELLPFSGSTSRT